MKLFKRLLVLATLFSFFCTFDGNAATNGNPPSVPLRKERKDKGHNNDLDEFSSFVLSQTGLIEIRVELDEYLMIGFLEI